MQLVKDLHWDQVKGLLVNWHEIASHFTFDRLCEVVAKQLQIDSPAALTHLRCQKLPLLMDVYNAASAASSSSSTSSSSSSAAAPSTKRKRTDSALAATSYTKRKKKPLPPTRMSLSSSNDFSRRLHFLLEIASPAFLDVLHSFQFGVGVAAQPTVQLVPDKLHGLHYMIGSIKELLDGKAFLMIEMQFRDVDASIGPPSTSKLFAPNDADKRDEWLYLAKRHIVSFLYGVLGFLTGGCVECTLWKRDRKLYLGPENQIADWSGRPKVDAAMGWKVLQAECLFDQSRSETEAGTWYLEDLLSEFALLWRKEVDGALGQ